jgi:hypothetical protein
MAAYELYLLLHVVGAAVWVGAAFLMVVLATRARLANDSDRTAALVADGAWLGPRVFLPANLAVLVSALLLVHEGRFGYDPLWIRLGVVGFAASFLTGALFFGPGWTRVARDPDGERTALWRLLLVSWIDVGWLVAIIFLMTVKPTSGDWSALVVAAGLPVAFCVLALALVRAPSPVEVTS